MSLIKKIKELLKLLYKKIKVSFIIKKIINFIKIYFTLPHIWISLIILILTFVALWLSIYYKSDSYLSSIYISVFTGLMTGLALSLISLIKSISLYITQNKINWLEMVHEQCLNYISESRKMYFSKKTESLTENEKYDKIYDLLCLGNDICVFISQGQYNDIYPFDTYKYSKKKLKFDTLQQQKNNFKLREKIVHLDISKINNKSIRELFKEMDNEIFNLNKNVLDRKKQLEIKNKTINIT